MEVKFVAAKASKNRKDQQARISCRQTVPSKALKNVEFQQISISGATWFGTMLSTPSKSCKISTLQISTC
jgi:hypothetical protein